MSAAAILIRKANAPPLGVAFWRNAFAVGLLIPVWGIRRTLAASSKLDLALPAGRDRLIALGSGVCLAAHFGLWIPSLSYTSVAVSVVLVCTQPIFVAILAAIVLKERTPAAGIAAIAFAVLGVGIIAMADDVNVGSRPQLGAALALGGALAVALYVLIGRALRSSGVGLLPYAILVYGAAAITLGIVAIALGTSLWGYSATSWGWLLAIAIGPQILGHTLFNWALGHVPAPVLSSSILLEPLISTLLAWAILKEDLTLQTGVGGAIILVGLGGLLWARRQPKET